MAMSIEGNDSFLEVLQSPDDYPKAKASWWGEMEILNSEVLDAIGWIAEIKVVVDGLQT